MVVLDDCIIGFAASYIAGNIPAIRTLLSRHQGLSDRIEGCYSKAINQWCKNAQIREYEYNHYNTLDNLISYLSGKPSANQTYISNLLSLWADEMRKDTICYDAILEIKDDLISAKLDGYYSDLCNLIVESGTRQYQSFEDASSSLRNVWAYVGQDYHIERKETKILYEWLKQEVDVTKKENVALLLGGPGQGKSVILHDLLIRLEREGASVLGLKSDMLFDSSDSDINEKLQVGVSVQSAIKREANEKQVVLLVDQIDALSSTLSSDRRPLSAINALITDVLTNPNVRVIISCRPYDLEYDSSLERYRHCKSIVVGKLSKDEILHALNTVGLNIESISPQLIELLGVPQNLFLFARLKKRDFSAISQNSLYDALWKEVVEDCPIGEFTSKDIIKFLSTLSKKLYERQALSINARALGSSWSKVPSYLITSGFLNGEDVYGNIQFIHQTLFDYVYARLFFESGQTLQSAFENFHQGLFVRPRMKQILEYQREVDAEKYIESIKRILFAKDAESGKYIYRYQLRHLALTLLAHQPTFLDEEKSLVANKILTSDVYRALFLDSARSLDAFNLIRAYIDKHGGFFSVCEELKNGILRLSEMISTDHPDILKYILSICTPSLDDNSKSRISRIVNYNEFQVFPREMELISDYLEEGALDIETSEYYQKLCTTNPDKVINRLSVLVENVMANDDNIHLFDVNLPLQADCVYSHFKEKNPARFLDLCMSLVNVMSKVLMGIPGEDILTSRLFYMYNRHNMSLHLSDKVLDDIFEYVENNKCGNLEKSKIIRDCFVRQIDVYHIIGIVCCLSEISFFQDLAFEYLKGNIKKTHYSSPLDYYQKELFAKLFMLLDISRQSVLMAEVAKVDPDWERVSLKGSPYQRTPISRIGYTKAQYYNSIPYDYLSEHFPSEKKFLDEMHRKYKSLENTEPNAMHSMTRWTTMKPSAYESMSDNDIIGSMEKYNSDINTDWEIPSKTGHAMVLQSMAEKSPERYFDIYMKALKKPAIDKFYIVEGLEGLMKGGLVEAKINVLLNLLISELDLNEINKNDPGLLIQITRCASYYLENGKNIPDFFLNFIINVAENAEDEIEEGKNYDVNDGINRVRGCACDYLVQCGVDPRNSDIVFETLKKIGVTASSATRCAALFQIGLLLNVDRKRTYDIVLRMTADHNPDLMKLPLHRYNPLLYLNSEEFEDFIPYFKASIASPDTHRVNTTLLLRAYLTDKKGSKELLLEMADSTGASRAELIRDIKDYYRSQYHAKCLELLLRYLNKDEPDLGRCYDDIFSILERWSSDVDDFVDKLTVSPICKYCNHYIYAFLDKVAVINPERCLIWLTNIYRLKKGVDDFNISVDRIITILVGAYNSIRKFDKENPVLENAMDLLDEVLSNDFNKWNMVKSLKQLDN